MMQSLKRLTAMAALAGLVSVGSIKQAEAFGFNPWTGMTGEKTIAINPFFYLPLSPVSFGFDTVGWIGLSKKVDLAVNFTSFNTAAGWGGFWVMPRVEIFPSGILGLTLGYNGAAPWVQPEFDFVSYPETGIFNFEANLRVPITFTAGATGLGVQAYLVPVLQFVKNSFAVFVEVNPGITILPATSFAMPINPGVWVAFGGGKHQFSLAFTGMSVTSAGFGVTPGLGLSYYTTVGF